MTENYALEIDFFGVGDGERSGDAIALRFGDYKNNQWHNQTVFVIDGGNLTSGQEIVDHVKNVYKTNKVDRVILTHPDSDHASGLRKVIEQLEIGKIWMHRPWNHWGDVKNSIVDGRITKNSFGDRLRLAYQYAYDIEKLAIAKGIEIFSPHQGSSYSIDKEKILTVLGPSKELYTSLIQASGKTPEMAVFESTRNFSATETTKTVYEDMDFKTENLEEVNVPTSAENDMSLILLLTVGKTKVLFTGDAGTQGMFKAIYYATDNDISLKDLDVFQVPHHGSRRNLSKGILKYIDTKYSIISCAANSPKHPSPIVVNSLIRRGMNPYSTKGILLNYHNLVVPQRAGLSPAAPLAFTNYVQISQ
ncbi:MAG: MBL fold metallo-hydrolase [Flavobacterium lindanitolerans]|uniref:ComEC/Rec2 family competence protein n=1 Tax=Flavobacterium lindanitolerans TaxID=428988 RepID=UPI001A3D6516|nr:MBL fold metallo-hydrolase [Flavobacterium lindanitolerans]MBL7867403.1 MBL fold metallo-hydrolase [Flavobacterium lindanitolerans]